MSTIGGTITETSTEVLVELDFPTPCGHSEHSIDSRLHDEGPAMFIASTWCPGGHAKVYPVCAKFAGLIPFVTLWNCRECGDVRPGSDYVWDIRPLNEPL